MCAKKFLSTPSARRATIISSIIVLPLSISIHALREEGDIVHGIGESLSFISIHALREEGDFARAGQRQRAKKFLSTPSARRATSTLSTEFDRKSYFYPRPPRGGRHGKPRPWKKHHTISIHALREEGDLRSATVLASHSPFLSTPSARRATSCPKDGRLATCISIHALREEGDCGTKRADAPFPKFLSTPSARRATLLKIEAKSQKRNFYPRPPRGGRLLPDGLALFELGISIHALREEGDYLVPSDPALSLHFYPRPPRGGRPAPRSTGSGRPFDFYPRPPRGGRQQKQRQNLYFLINYTTFCTNLEEP